MQIHEIQIKNKRKSKKRIARGGKRGTTAGRGTKGQKSRAGHKIRPAVRDLLQRLPKLRGYKNNRKSDIARVINISSLEKSKLINVNLVTLTKAGLIKKTDKKVKILGNGELTKKIVVSDVLVSSSAKTKIEAAGGKVEIQVDKLA